MLVSMSVALNEKSDCIEDRRIDTLATINEFFTLHHLLGDCLDKVLILFLGSEVLFKVFSQVL